MEPAAGVGSSGPYLAADFVAYLKRAAKGNLYIFLVPSGALRVYGLAPDSSQLLSRFPTLLASDLFASAKPVKLAADQGGYTIRSSGTLSTFAIFFKAAVVPFLRPFSRSEI